MNMSENSSNRFQHIHATGKEFARFIASLFAAQPNNINELAKAQFAAFSKQMPLLYFMLLVNVWTVAIVQAEVAPLGLTLVAPTLFTVLCGIRLVKWSANGLRVPTGLQARKELRLTNYLSACFAFLVLVWAMLIFPHGNSYQQFQVGFFLSMTAFGSVICLMHLRSAALIVAGIFTIPFVAFFGSADNPVFVAMAINVALVSIAIVIIALIYSRDFAELVQSRSDLERKRMEAVSLGKENLRLANLDSLTELPNRRAFFTTLEYAHKVAAEQSARLAVAIIDLDGFKPVNDLYGHAVGDALLREVGLRLSEACSEDIHLSRLGGDEFAVVIPAPGDDDSLLRLGESFCQALYAPFSFNELTIRISCSVGLSTYPDIAHGSQELLACADYALMEMKKLKRGGAMLFTNDHHAQIHREARIEQALQLADLDSELSVVFQPVFDIQSGSLSGFEALARWESPVLGAIPPGQFIPVAERCGIIGRLTRSLLQKALAAARQWPSGFRLSINMSAHDLTSPESVLGLLALIKKSGFDPRRLDIEITETALALDFDQMQAAVGAFKALGCGILLDDFGVGYSNLARLHSLPLTKIKIDRSLVINIRDNPASSKIIRSLLALARDMGLGCVVEGVETEEQVEELKSFGDLLVQGFLYSPPIPMSDVAGFCEKRMEPAPTARLMAG